MPRTINLLVHISTQSCFFYFKGYQLNHVGNKSPHTHDHVVTVVRAVCVADFVPLHMHASYYGAKWHGIIPQGGKSLARYLICFVYKTCTANKRNMRYKIEYTTLALGLKLLFTPMITYDDNDAFQIRTLLVLGAIAP